MKIEKKIVKPKYFTWLALALAGFFGGLLIN